MGTRSERGGSQLQGYLNIHMGTINILLAEHGLEMMKLASDSSATERLNIRERLDDTRGMLQKIGDGLGIQMLIIKNTQNMIIQLFEMIGGEFKTSWRSLGEMVAKVCISTQQTYSILVEIKDSLVGVNTQWTFFQAPLVMEDALGYKFPVPSEYDFDLIDAIIKHRFSTGPGSREVQSGNYEYFKTKNSDQVLSRTSRILPGMAVTMAILVDGSMFIDERCPIPSCNSTQTVESPGGGKICCACNVWFTPTKKKRRPLQALLVSISTIDIPLTGETRYNEPLEGEALIGGGSFEQDDASAFRNVRYNLALLNQLEVSTSASCDRGADIISPKHNDEETVQELTSGPSLNDAFSYMDRIKASYTQNIAVYHLFLDIMRQFKEGILSVTDVIVRITVLFRNTPALINGFNEFMPPSHKIAFQHGSRVVTIIEKNQPDRILPVFEESNMLQLLGSLNLFMEEYSNLKSPCSKEIIEDNA